MPTNWFVPDCRMYLVHFRLCQVMINQCTGFNWKALMLVSPYSWSCPDLFRSERVNPQEGWIVATLATHSPLALFVWEGWPNVCSLCEITHFFRLQVQLHLIIRPWPWASASERVFCWQPHLATRTNNYGIPACGKLGDVHVFTSWSRL